MNKPAVSQALGNLLHALEREMLAAGDEEVLAAADELGLKPDMQGSIALVGVTKLVRYQPMKAGVRSASGKSPRRRNPTPRRPKA